MNEAGIALVKSFEGCQLTAYRDLGGVWSIGYGSTKNVHEGDVITEAQADQLLRTELHAFYVQVINWCESITSDNQASAMTSMSYNIGPNAFYHSTVLRLHNAGQYIKAANAFLMWDHVTINNVLTVVPGLLRRRQAERALYLQTL